VSCLLLHLGEDGKDVGPVVVACGILALAWFPWCAGACPLLRARALL